MHFHNISTISKEFFVYEKDTTHLHFKITKNNETILMIYSYSILIIKNMELIEPRNNFKLLKF